jgi:hypothetical protein
MPVVSSIVAACEMIRRGDAGTVTIDIPTTDASTVLAITRETADQAGIDLEARATASGVILTLRRRESRAGK